MKFIIVSNKTGKHRSFNANAFIFGVALAGLISIPAAAGYLAYQFGVGDAGLTGEMVAKWREVLGEQRASVEATKRRCEADACGVCASNRAASGKNRSFRRIG